MNEQTNMISGVTAASLKMLPKRVRVNSSCLKAAAS
tara:strand:- start:1063 stop:1170 length:108 start_codon:yes stop_codon:yes gene_type:complete